MWEHSLLVHGSSSVLGYTLVSWIQVSSLTILLEYILAVSEWWYRLHSVLEFTVCWDDKRAAKWEGTYAGNRNTDRW